MCARARARARVCVRVHVCVCVCACACARVRVCVRARALHTRARVCVQWVSLAAGGIIIGVCVRALTLTDAPTPTPHTPTTLGSQHLMAGSKTLNSARYEWRCWQ